MQQKNRKKEGRKDTIKKVPIKTVSFPDGYQRKKQGKKDIAPDRMFQEQKKRNIVRTREGTGEKLDQKAIEQISTRHPNGMFSMKVNCAASSYRISQSKSKVNDIRKLSGSFPVAVQNNASSGTCPAVWKQQGEKTQTEKSPGYKESFQEQPEEKEIKETRQMVREDGISHQPFPIERKSTVSSYLVNHTSTAANRSAPSLVTDKKQKYFRGQKKTRSLPDEEEDTKEEKQKPTVRNTVRPNRILYKKEIPYPKRGKKKNIRKNDSEKESFSKRHITIKPNRNQEKKSSKKRAAKKTGASGFKKYVIRKRRLKTGLCMVTGMGGSLFGRVSETVYMAQKTTDYIKQEEQIPPAVVITAIGAETKTGALIAQKGKKLLIKAVTKTGKTMIKRVRYKKEKTNSEDAVSQTDSSFKKSREALKKESEELFNGQKKTFLMGPTEPLDAIKKHRETQQDKLTQIKEQYHIAEGHTNQTDFKQKKKAISRKKIKETFKGRKTDFDSSKTTPKESKTAQKASIMEPLEAGTVKKQERKQDGLILIKEQYHIVESRYEHTKHPSQYSGSIEKKYHITRKRKEHDPREDICSKEKLTEKKIKAVKENKKPNHKKNRQRDQTISDLKKKFMIDSLINPENGGTSGIGNLMYQIAKTKVQDFSLAAVKNITGFILSGLASLFLSILSVLGIPLLILILIFGTGAGALTYFLHNDASVPIQSQYLPNATVDYYKQSVLDLYSITVSNSYHFDNLYYCVDNHRKDSYAQTMRFWKGSEEQVKILGTNFSDVILLYLVKADASGPFLMITTEEQKNLLKRCYETLNAYHTWQKFSYKINPDTREQELVVSTDLSVIVWHLEAYLEQYPDFLTEQEKETLQVYQKILSKEETVLQLEQYITFAELE